MIAKVAVWSIVSAGLVVHTSLQWVHFEDAVVVDIEKLLSPSAKEPPCGPNLEYTDSFRQLGELIVGSPERRIGDQVKAGAPPNWAKAHQEAIKLFAETKDVRIAIYLARALTRLRGIEGLVDGLNLLREMLDRYWEEVHPKFDPVLAKEGGDERLNALANLADSDGLLRDVRQAVVAEVAGKGRVRVADVLIAAGKLAPTPGEEFLAAGVIAGLFADAAGRGSAALRAAAELTRSVDELGAVIGAKAGVEHAQDLAALRTLVVPVNEAAARVLGAKGAATGGGGVGGERFPEGGGPSGGASGGAIRSRDDASTLLDQVCDFLERNEPAHPAQLLIRRAQRLLGMNFLEIIDEVAPDGLKAVKGLAGIKDSSE